MTSDALSTFYPSTVVTNDWSTATNDTDDDDDSSAPYHVSPIFSFEAFIFVFVPILFGIIAVLGFVGNLLVILVVVFERQMRSPTNILIVSLAVADILFILICVPLTAYRYAMTDWPFGNVVCKLYQYMTNVTAYASVYTLVLMSFDRYLAVVHPVNSIGFRTERNTVAVLVVLWVVICVVNVPNWIEYAHIVYPYAGENRSECVNARIFEEIHKGVRRHGRVVYGCFFAFAYLVPLVSVCVLYGIMLRRLLRGMMPGTRGAGGGGGGGGPQQSSHRVRSKRRVTRLVVVVVLMFALCWLPVQIVLVVQNFSDVRPSRGFVLALVVANCFAYMNSCVNPFLYAFLSENFRKSFYKLVSCGRMKGQGGTASTPADIQLNNIRSMEPLTRSSGINHIGGAQSSKLD